MILTFVASIFASAGIAYAQSERVIHSYPFISAIPKHANVGETVLINFGLLNNLARVNDGWNVTAVITDPDGVVTRIDGMTWSTGTVGKSFVPTKEGDYKLVCTFDRVYYAATSAALTGWYMAGESDPFILTVTVGEGKQSYPGHKLPTEYWTRPIDSQLREWYSISGSWVATSVTKLVEYNEPVLSPHILWRMPIGDSNGGLVGGDFAYGYQDGDAYEGKYAGPIMLAGILYYNKYASGMPTQAIVAVDVHTGEKLWERSYTGFSTSRIVTGQILSWDSYNNRGGWAYIWLSNGTTMYALEAYTGDLVYNMTNVPSGSLFYGKNGELLKYVYSNLGTAAAPDWHLRQWNSSYVVTYTGDPDMSWGSAVRGRSFNATERGFDIDIPLAAPNNGGLFGGFIWAFPNDKVIIGSTSATTTGENITLSAVSLKRGSVGNILFKNVVWKAPDTFLDIQAESYRQSTWGAITPEVIVFWEKNTRLHYAFSLETGQFLWKTTISQNFEDSWQTAYLTQGGQTGFSIIVYDKLISTSCAGVVYCYDIKTGERLWTYEATDKYTESYLSENWWLFPLFVVDGIVYFGHGEHSTLIPKPRGAPFFALNVDDGSIVWESFGLFRQSMWGGQAIMADSVIITQDTYDQQIYAVGKGPSSITVSTPTTAVTAGKPLLITGTIMDVSPGTQDDKIKLRFSNGVPAIADDDMNEWMLYVYKQFDLTTEVKGVCIDLWTYGPNGAEIHIGETVSDAQGNFAIQFTPGIEGQYDIWAFFYGSNSYYGDYANTSLLATEADKTTPYGLYLICLGIAILAAIIVSCILILRKK